MDHNTSRGAAGAGGGAGVASGSSRARARQGAARAGGREATTGQPGRRTGSGNGGVAAAGTATATATAGEMERDAKTVSDEMRVLFKTMPPWSREVEALRQKCRNIHLAILFTHPFSPHAHSLDPTWIQTSYLPIAAFREHVSRADAVVASLAKPSVGVDGRRAHASNTNTHPRGPSEPTQELKKVLTRFRQFLASEEGWYRHLLQRLDRFFALGGLVRGALEQVGLGSSRDAGAAGDGEAQVEGLRLEDKRDKLALVHKALICLGDIERYREQYSDVVRRGDVSKERYVRARGYYEAARSVLPDEGSAYNQLAVICTYLPDEFSAVYYYYRSLAVRVTFRGADEILERYLRKAYERWAARGGARRRAERDADGTGKAVTRGKATEQGDVELDADGLKSELVVLISIIHRQHSAGFDSIGPLKAAVLPSLARLVLARALPSEIIVKLSSIVIGTHWSARNASSLLGAAPSPSAAASADTRAEYARAHRAEDEALALLLGIFGVLLSAGASEVEGVLRAVEASGESAVIDEDDEEGAADLALAKRITPALRRMLPSLRVLSKWLKLHLDYLLRFAPPPTPPGDESAAPVVEVFWGAYYRFIEALARAFPLGQLPSCATGMSGAGADMSGVGEGAGDAEQALEEDEDMRGYLPVERGFAIYRDRGKGVGGGSGGSGPGHASGADSEREGATHRRTPDEEGLMRIADLEVDATLVLQAQTQTQMHAEVEAGMMEYEREGRAAGQGAGAYTAAQHRPLDEMDDGDDADAASVSTNTEDDPVNLAMRATLGSESEGGSEVELGVGAEEAAGRGYGADVWGTSTFAQHATAVGQAQYDHGPTVALAQPPQPVSPGAGTAYDLLAGLMLGPANGVGGVGAPLSGAYPPSGLAPGSGHSSFNAFQHTPPYPASPHGAAFEYGTPPGSRLGAAGAGAPPVASPGADSAPPPLTGDGVWAMTREESNSQKGRVRGAGPGAEVSGQAAWGSAGGPGYPNTPRGAVKSQEGYPRGGQGSDAVGQGRVRDIWAGGAQTQAHAYANEMRTPAAGSLALSPPAPAHSQSYAYGREQGYGRSHSVPAQNHGIGMAAPPLPMAGPVGGGMDAAQLLAGISGLGGMSATAWGAPGPRQGAGDGWGGQAPAPADAPGRFGGANMPAPGQAMGDAGRWR